MDDRTPVVPHDDDPLLDSLYIDNILSFANDSFLDDLNLSPLRGPYPYPPPIPQSGDGIAGSSNNPVHDTFDWEAHINTTVNNSEVGPSEVRNEQNPQPRNQGYGNSMPLPVWPPSPIPFCCSFCQVLREIIHTNGNHTTKLEIHGRFGMICHAILENRYSSNEIPPSHERQMFDFCKHSIENVKEFLLLYCDERKQAGYILLEDPLSIFYEALCVGLDLDDNMCTDDFFQSSPSDSGEDQVNQPGAGNNAERNPRISLAAQRERTAKLTLAELAKYFHLPIEPASKKLRLCPTVVKKICRRNGIYRWPYRKIRSLEKKISVLTESLTEKDAEGRAYAQSEIERLQQVIMNICAGAPP